MFEAIVFMYSENQKTVDDFKTQVMTLNYLIEMRKIKCAVYTYLFHFIRDFLSYYQNYFLWNNIKVSKVLLPI